MDNDDFRRGRPACHKKFGEALAIYAGDALLALAFEIMSGFGHEKSAEIIFVMARAVGPANLLGGQALDLGYGARAKKTDRRLRNKINSMKTAALMAASCEAGALAAKAGRCDMKRVREFGKNLGLAFQIADDLEDASHTRRYSKSMKNKARHYILKGKRQLRDLGKRADIFRYIADLVMEKAACHGKDNAKLFG